MPRDTRPVRSSAARAAPRSKACVARYVLSVLVALFLVFDGGGKLVQPEPVVKAFAQLGVPMSQSTGIGLLLLACTVLYVIPRTAVLGAVLLTGYLGGAVAIQVRAVSGLFPDVFPLIMGAMVWGGLYLRDERVKAMLPW